MDADCDGTGDSVMVASDDKDAPVMAFTDDDGDGTISIDADRDGEYEVALFDTDHDGKIDMRGDYRPGESEPYQYGPFTLDDDKHQAKR